MTIYGDDNKLNLSRSLQQIFIGINNDGKKLLSDISIMNITQCIVNTDNGLIGIEIKYIDSDDRRVILYVYIIKTGSHVLDVTVSKEQLKTMFANWIV